MDESETVLTESFIETVISSEYEDTTPAMYRTFYGMEEVATFEETDDNYYDNGGENE
jgi:hypothetical protein